MFVCNFMNDDDGMEYFGVGETMCEAFENLELDNGFSIDPDDGGIRFFERVSHVYEVKPRFEKF